MYINFKLMKSRGLCTQDVMVLQMCRQNTPDNSHETELVDLLENDEHVLESFEKDGFVKFIKGNAKDSVFKRARITKKGEKMLEDLQAFKVEKEDIVIYDWLKKKYKEAGKEIGSEKKGLELCSWFRQASGITRNRLAKLCETFIKDEERMQYSMVLQYIFWKPESHFQLKPKLEDSKLWLYYEKHRDFFEELFEKNGI